MKRFIIHILSFSLVLFIVFGLFHWAIIRTQYKTLRLPKSTTAVFLGNSTVEYGINDAMIPGTVNWGLNGEVVDMMYLKLKALKQVNPHIKTAFVEFDDVILFKTNLEYVTTHPYYLNQLTVGDLANNFKHQSFQRSTDYLSHVYDFIKLRQIVNCSNSSSSLTDLGMGGFEYLHRDLGEADSIVTAKNMYIKNSEINQEPVPQNNIYYYKAIRQYCNDNHIKLYFIATPRHRCAWNETRFRGIHQQHFADVPLLDFTMLSLPDSCYGDSYHINYRGAAILSSKLASKNKATYDGIISLNKHK